MATRPRDAGVVLVTTLLMLVLLAGMATAAQGRALALARLAARVAEGHRAAAAESSARAMVRPLVGESLLAEGEGATGPIPLDGTSVTVTVDGVAWETTAERMERRGWVRMSGELDHKNSWRISVD